jgi:hypothetical protein
MSQADLATDTTANRPEETRSPSLAVLIEVPGIDLARVARTPRGMPRRTRTASRPARRTRRRLRREVRVAGCAMIALAPIVSVCTLGWSSRPERIVACSIADPINSSTNGGDSIGDPKPAYASSSAQPAFAGFGAVVLSSESADAAPGSAADAAVIIPGYVLPDDSREDSLHEGS